MVLLIPRHSFVSSSLAKIELSIHFDFFTFNKTNSSQQAFLVLGFLGATPSFSQLIRNSLKMGLDMSTNLISLVSVLKRWNKKVYRHIATRKHSLPRRIKNVQAALDHKCSKFLLELEMDLGFEYDKVLD
ncbi:hypothetical protein PVK06_048875 [Gossypium arboreum]|uniref:Uncharacterized protein n=1 Tax=Gossypium arboreum TaxID=29729 RepID=A0ABR0MH85_GOSAR|nr:hypothetical protein PVK06_048875 [Gossypium arboreum]